MPDPTTEQHIKTLERLRWRLGDAHLPALTHAIEALKREERLRGLFELRAKTADSDAAHGHDRDYYHGVRDAYVEARAALDPTPREET